jgi:hypothetical protein
MAATVTNLADWRSLRSWAAAAAHLNALGYAAAVPAGLVPVLSKRGLVVWASEDREAA